MSKQRFPATLAIASLLACGGVGETPTGPGTTEVRVVAGAPVTDTILARPVQALVVEARVDGQPRPGLVIRFESLPGKDPNRPYQQAVTVSRISQNAFGFLASDTTNVTGRASVLVQLGGVAGEARVVVSSPELGLADTATFMVTPGNAARLAITVKDTVLVAGGSYVVGAQVNDRFGNTRADPVTFSAGPNTASVDATGRVVVGSTTGRGAIAVSAGGVTDSARFTVLPAGTMASIHFTNDLGSIATSKFDGSSLKLITAASTPAYPTISPSDDLIAYQQLEIGGWVIYVVDGAGTRKRLVDTSLVQAQQYPHFSGDGQFIYFSGRRPGEGFAVWRARTDGTSLTKVVNTSPVFSDRQNLAVSPDGSRIAYPESNGITIMQLATGARTQLSGSATFLEFSPDSKRLAYLGGSIRVVNIDGTSPKAFGNGFVSSDPGLTWLPGSEWLLVRGYAGPLIANASTGELIQLPLADFYQMSARP